MLSIGQNFARTVVPDVPIVPRHSLCRISADRVMSVDLSLIRLFQFPAAARYYPGASYFFPSFFFQAWTAI